jgi:hypothetical protein
MAQKFLNGIASTGNVLPSVDSTYDLGHNSYRWANLYVDAIGTTSTFVSGGTIALQSSISTLNKAETAYVSFATRNISGSETLMDLSNVGTINAGTINVGNVSMTGLSATAGSFTQGVTIADVIDGDFTALRLMNQKTYGSGTGTNEKVRFVMGISENGISFAGREGFAIEVGVGDQSDSSDGVVEFKVRDGGTLGTYSTVTGSDKSVSFVGDLTANNLSGTNTGDQDLSAYSLTSNTPLFTWDSTADLTSPSASTGTWTNATDSNWGRPRIGTSLARFNDGTGTLSFAVPTGMKTAYISMLTWTSGGYMDVYGVQADGDEVWLRRINTKQNVELDNEGDSNDHDGSTIVFAGHIGAYPTIMLHNQVGRFHPTGLGFSKSELVASEGTGMVNYSQLQGTPPTWNQNTTGNADTVTTNANLTGHITSVGNATALNSFTTAELNAAISDGTINSQTLPTDFVSAANGGTFNGDVVINSAGDAASPLLRLNNSSSNAFNHALEALNANLTTTETELLLVGKSADTRNSGYIGFNWVADNSNSNYISIGHWGYNHLLKIYPTGDATFSGNVTCGNLHASSFTDVITNSILTASADLDIKTVLTTRDVRFRSGSNAVQLRVKGDATGILINDHAGLRGVSATSATATTIVAEVPHALYNGIFFDFVIKNGTNVRAGTLTVCHDGTNVEYAETSTVDLGDTSDVTLSSNISGTSIRLIATTTSSTWTIKSLIRTI